MKSDQILADRYQIREQLSKKNGRRTFLAQDLQSEALVIVKILRFDADCEWDDHKLFEREANTLQNLHHPAIPNYLDYFEVDEADTRGFALVQTYINAPSLETVVKGGRKFSEAEAIELADRLLSILTYLHEQIPPVIHRDIKPSNILLDNRSGNSIGDVYLVDFGSVQTAASKDGGTITIVGSYGYIPLEQFGGQTTPASDLYSLGMTIIYLLTGTHPAELTPVNGQVKFTAQISNRFHRWLEKMTQPHLDKRFDSARLAQIALTSEDNSYGNFTHLKPADTRVKLDRNRDRIEIRFPEISNKDFGLLESHISLLYNALAVVLSYILVMLLYWNLLIFFLPLLPLVLVIVFDVKKNSQLYSYRVISIDRLHKNIRTGKSSQTSAKIKWDKSLFTNSCEIIIYNPGYAFSKQLNIKRGEFLYPGIDISPDLQMYCGANQQSFKDLSQNNLRRVELCWLAHELSDFLDLELQVIYPASKLPEETLRYL